MEVASVVGINLASDGDDPVLTFIHIGFHAVVKQL
jgi:hypothetical protein